MCAADQHRVDLPQVYVCRGRHAVAQQRIDRYAQRIGNIDDGRQAQLGRAALDVRDVGRLLIGQLGQRLLRQPQFLPVPPDADADCNIVEFQFAPSRKNFLIMLLYIRFGCGRMFYISE